MGYLPSINKFGLSYSNPRNVQYVLIENRQTLYIRFMNNYIEAHINEILAFATYGCAFIYISVSCYSFLLISHRNVIYTCSLLVSIVEHDLGRKSPTLIP